MRNTLFIILLSSFLSVSAQSSDQEKIIRDLEKKAAHAVMVKDTATLRQLWSDDFKVNSPRNIIATPGANTGFGLILNELNYFAFERNTELVRFLGETAISMGSEVVTLRQPDGTAGNIVNRRYTNIWMKEGAGWKLKARHASIICD